MARAKSRFRQFTDEQWERIEPLLPSNAGRQGHPFGDNRKVVEGIVYRYRTGIPWRDLPREEFGPWQTVWKRHARYARDGTWDRVLQTILADADAAGRSTGTSQSTPRSVAPTSTARTQPAPNRTQGARSNHKNRPAVECEPAGHGIGRSRGGLTTKIHSAVDGRGRPLANVVTGGQRNDGAMLAEVLADIHVPRLGRGRPRTRPDAVIADKAYSSGTIRRQLRSRNIAAVIPEKSDTIAARTRRGSRGGRPPKLNTDLYKGRNVVERAFARVKQWRALATRYDKHAITYRAAVTIFSILTWVRLIGDTP